MANDNEQKKIDLTPVADIPVVDEFADKDLDTTGVEIHTDEGSAAVSAVEADYGADQIQIQPQPLTLPRCLHRYRLTMVLIRSRFLRGSRLCGSAQACTSAARQSVASPRIKSGSLKKM